MRFDTHTRRLDLDPGDPGFYNDPYAVYRRLHASPGPVFWQDFGFWCFSAHAAVSSLLRDKRFGRQILHLTTRQNLGWSERASHLADFDAVERNSLLELEPPEHSRLRALVNRAFVSRQVERLAPRIAALAEQCIETLVPGGDLIAGFATPIPIGVIAELIGAPADDAATLLDWSHKMVAMYRLAPTRADEDAAAAAARAFACYVRGLAAERRRAPRDDLLSQLIAAESDAGRLSEDELVSTVILLLNAGHEATVHALGNATKALLEHGAPFDGLEAAVEELLRFDPPLHMFTRFALQDLDIEGLKLRQGDRVGLLLGAANRDLTVFAAPDRLDLSRARNPHVAFGGGIHFCVGAPLARLEMRVALSVLFRRLPGLKLVEAPRYRDAYHFRGLEALKVSWPQRLK